MALRLMSGVDNDYLPFLLQHVSARYKHWDAVVSHFFFSGTTGMPEEE